jgi:hypothetical protein
VKPLVLLLALAWPARADEPLAPPPGTADAFRQFAAILDVLQKHYIEPANVRPAERATLAFRQFVRSLDPGADLLSPDEFAAAKNPTNAPAPGTAEITNLAPGIAYCRLTATDVVAARALREQLLPARRSHRLVLDLRDNPGGSLDGALQCASLFLPAQTRIVALDFARPEQRIGFVSDSSPKFHGPVVLLINAGTAAEAEIVTAALRDNGRALLVGSRTAGRAMNYELYALPDGSGLKIPTARYLPPSKRPFHGTGLWPDFVADANATNDVALARALEWLAKSGSIRADEPQTRH